VHFIKNDKTNLRQIFFSGFRRKYLFKTTWIKKQCTQPFNCRGLCWIVYAYWWVMWRV